MREIFFQIHDFSGTAEELFSLFADQPHAFLLESRLWANERGRFSFIGFDPFDIVRSSGRTSLDRLKKHFEPYDRSVKTAPVPFAGGIVGYLGYDLGLYLENILIPNKDNFSLPDCVFGFYDGIFAIDHFASKLYILAAGLPEKEAETARRHAKAKIKDLDRLLKKRSLFSKSYNPCKTLKEKEDTHNIHLESNFTKGEYQKAIRKALNYIAQGEIYQVNLSQRFLFKRRSDCFVEGWKLYQQLNAIAPSHFSAYFNAGDFQIISHSPEEFLRLREKKLFTFPMKGTRPRGENIIGDETMKKDLLNSPKEKAELLMVTDLERNDLGKICDYGSVKVHAMRLLEQYATVFQTISIVEGNVRKEKDAFDVLKACFPSGSVTGCPKIRAMEIISQIEKTRRGPYTGSFGYIGFDGSMDFNILIRTFVHKEDWISFHVGGGIVSDSVAEQEYEETLVKAKALKQALIHTACR